MNSEGTNMKINTTPEQMDTAALEIAKQKIAIEDSINSMKSIVDSIGESWAGAAASTFKSRFEEFYGKIKECIKAADSYQLAMISATMAYRQTESEIQAEANRFQ